MYSQRARIWLCRNSRGVLQMPCKPVEQACGAGVSGALSCCGCCLLHFGVKLVLRVGELCCEILRGLLLPSLVSHVNAVAELVELFLPRANWVTSLTQAAWKPFGTAGTGWQTFCCFQTILTPSWTGSREQVQLLYSNKDLMPANWWSLSSPSRTPCNDMKLTFKYLARDQELGGLLFSFP